MKNSANQNKRSFKKILPIIVLLTLFFGAIIWGRSFLSGEGGQGLILKRSTDTTTNQKPTNETTPKQEDTIIDIEELRKQLLAEQERAKLITKFSVKSVEHEKIISNNPEINTFTVKLDAQAKSGSEYEFQLKNASYMRATKATNNEIIQLYPDPNGLVKFPSGTINFEIVYNLSFPQMEASRNITLRAIRGEADYSETIQINSFSGRSAQLKCVFELEKCYLNNIAGANVDPTSTKWTQITPPSDISSCDGGSSCTLSSYLQNPRVAAEFNYTQGTITSSKFIGNFNDLAIDYQPDSLFIDMGIYKAENVKANVGGITNLLKLSLNNTRFDNAIIDLTIPNANYVNVTLPDGSRDNRFPNANDQVQLPAGSKDITVFYQKTDAELANLLIEIDVKLTRGAEQTENTIILPIERPTLTCSSGTSCSLNGDTSSTESINWSTTAINNGTTLSELTSCDNSPTCTSSELNQQANLKVEFNLTDLGLSYSYIGKVGNFIQ